MRGAKIIPGFLLAASTFASSASLLVLPIGGNADKRDLMVVNVLYREALRAQFNGTVLFVDSLKACDDRNCALNAARQVNADQVVYSSLYRIGEKGIFSSSILSANTADIFKQRLTASSLEEMENITKRMADALLNRKNMEPIPVTDKRDSSADFPVAKGQQQDSMADNPVSTADTTPTPIQEVKQKTPPSGMTYIGIGFAVVFLIGIIFSLK